ncbi:MAG: hypothetical protein HYV27_18605 [Candidatus Hydrogenedentes bacterium]|nr:hypothetical protein [Candidatus Hydrogenedentota bacterium]
MKPYPRFAMAGLLLPVLAYMMPIGADSIAVNGERFDGVYVRETTRNYYVQFPETGTVRSFPRSQVAPEQVVLTGDAQERDALLARWTAQSRAATQTPKDTAAPVLSPAPEASPTPAPPVAARERREAPRPSGAGGAILPEDDPAHAIRNLQLQGVPLGTALKAILRSVNLDYEIYDGIIYVSDPATLRRESFEDVEVRSYELKDAGAETLPKIVVNHTGLGSDSRF